MSVMESGKRKKGIQQLLAFSRQEENKKAKKKGGANRSAAFFQRGKKGKFPVNPLISEKRGKKGAGFVLCKKEREKKQTASATHQTSQKKKKGSQLHQREKRSRIMTNNIT